MGSLLGLTNLSDETSGAVARSPYDLSYWWDIKHKHTLETVHQMVNQAGPKRSLVPSL